MAIVNNYQFIETSIPDQEAQHLAFSKFEELPTEVIGEIFAQMDSPTQSSFSWISKKYYKIYSDPDFDTFEFGQKCAKLGYETLLLYCIKQGGLYLLCPGEIIYEDTWRFVGNPISKAGARYGYFFEKIYDTYERARAPQASLGTLLKKYQITQIKQIKPVWTGSHWDLGSHQIMENEPEARESLEEFQKLVARESYLEECQKIEEQRALVSMIYAASLGGHQELVNKLKARTSFQNSEFSIIAELEYKLEGGHLGLAQQLFTELNEKPKMAISREAFFRKNFVTELNEKPKMAISREAFLRKIFDTGLRKNLPLLILYAYDQQPSLLSELDAHIIKHLCKNGDIDIFELAFKQGIPSEDSPIIKNLVQSTFTSEENYFEFVKHLALKYKLSFSFEGIPKWANRKALHWMQAQGFIHFDQSLLENYLEHEDKNYKIEAIQWFLEQGGVITPRAVYLAARLCRLSLLNFLWEHRPKDMVLDSTLAVFFQDMNKGSFVLPFRRSVRWLLAKGCTWGDPCSVYDNFLLLLLKNNTKLALDFMLDYKIPYGFILTQAIPSDVARKYASLITEVIDSSPAQVSSKELLYGDVD